MSTKGAQAGLETFDKINIDYEHAYLDNQVKKSCINQAISLLPIGSRVLDVGCGTGLPVSDMLAKAGLQVHGLDIAPTMVQLARERVKGTFSVSDMLEFKIEEDASFAGVFIIYSQLQLSYRDFHAAAYKFAGALQRGGLFVIGQSPIESQMKECEGHIDETGTYVEGVNIPFMGEYCFTLLFSKEGQKDFLRSMGLEILWETVEVFQPNDPRSNPETQQYLIAKRLDDKPLTLPKPLPKEKR